MNGLLIVLFIFGASSQFLLLAHHLGTGETWRAAADLAVAVLCSVSAILNVRQWRRARRRVLK